MQTTSKLRSLRKLQTRDSPHASPAMSSTSARRDMQMVGKRVNRSASAADKHYDYMDVMPLTRRRNSSCEILIPQFMIPCSASSLMDKQYALSPPSTAPPSFGDDDHRTDMSLLQ